MQNTIFTFDVDNFSNILKKAIENEQVIFRDGVAYWKKGLEQTGIIQHIPLKPVDLVRSQDFITSMSSIQSTLQSTMVAVQAISTASLMVAMVVQTQILSQKIEKVQQSVLQVSKDIQDQNMLFYTDKVSEYLGVLQNFKLLLDKRTNLDAVQLLANNTLSTSIQIKNHLLGFMRNLLQLITDQKITSHHNIELILQFFQQMMEILPIGMHLEFILSHRLKQNEFSQLLIENSHQQYLMIFEQYRDYLNMINNGIRDLSIKPEEVPYFAKIKIPALNLIKSSLRIELLEKPALENLAYQNEKKQSMAKLG